MIPRDRRTFLFSATMTKKVDGVFFYCVCLGLCFLCLKRRLIETFIAWGFLVLITGPETTESSSERSCEVCSLKQIFHSRQTSAVLHFHTIKVQSKLQSITHCFMFLYKNTAADFVVLL